MRLSDDFQLLFRFGEGDVKAGLPLTEPARRNCKAMVVFPVPGSPSMRRGDRVENPH
jgi:hypothetical protein